jgi:hypothetical protein
MVDVSRREAIIEVANKLFVYTDRQDWVRLLKEVFAESVLFDMSSAGGPPAKKISPREICEMWKKGFEGIDAIHHQAGNYIVTFRDEVNADVICYAIALHYRKDEARGNVREFVGSYDLAMVFTDQGWRIDGFRYNLKYINGNAALE